MNSATARLIDCRSARSSCRNNVSFPVSCRRSSMAPATLLGSRPPIYTFALWFKRACAPERSTSVYGRLRLVWVDGSPSLYLYRYLYSRR